MVVAYFDCFSGICGDMILGALIDLGVEKDFFIREIEKLNLSGYKIHFKKINVMIFLQQMLILLSLNKNIIEI